MNYKAIYAVKVWLTAAAIAPIFVLGYDMLRAQHYAGATGFGDIGDTIEFFLMMAFFGSIFSLPSFLLLWLTTYLVTINEKVNIVYQKLILSTTGVVLTIAPFKLLDYSMGSFSTITIYAAMIVSCIWIYRLPTTYNIDDHQPELTQTDSQLPGNRQEDFPPAEPDVN